jgi:hypothetical protein
MRHNVEGTQWTCTNVLGETSASIFRVEAWAKREKKGKDMGLEKEEPELRAIQWEKAILKNPNAFKG